MSQTEDPKARVKEIQLILRRMYLTPDERRSLETELFKLLKAVVK